MIRNLRNGIARSAFGLALGFAVPLALAAGARAEDAYCAEGDCRDQVRGKVEDNGSAGRVAAGENTELETADDGGGSPFSISVDGEPVSGARKPADAKRATDLALESVDIQVKFDGLETRTILNVSTAPIRRAYQAGETVTFLATSNYWPWIDMAEIRVYEDGKSASGAPLHILPVPEAGTVEWTMPEDGPKDFFYVLRVYDGEGRYDETRPLTLARSETALGQHEPQDASVAPGAAEDGTATRNIPVYGGAVTVYGRNIPEGNSVVVMGEAVPVDPDGAFVVQRILPPGDHEVAVAVSDAGGRGLDFNRDINIPASEWFYVALADLTVGHRFGGKGIEDIKPGDFDDVYTKGRLAFYLKGKIKGRTLLTAAADTGEDDIENIFKGLDDKDPRQFLRRIDPDDYYPVYGDDSSAIEDAPTRGKFYVRLERGDSHVMWGNFKTRITGTQFLRNERALYGASAVYRSERQAPNNERSTEISGYAAQPGTLPQRDILRGTGGSAYFLRHQDVTIGSETVTVEVRDRVTNRVIDRRTLRYGIDYDIDYIQGVVLLRSPLPSTTSADGLVRADALGGNPVNLVVSYEFTPAASDVDGYVYGGRAQQWIGDHSRVGVTGMNEKTGAADQKLYGADVRIQHSERTYIEGEFARSEGPGFGNAYSADGGLTIDEQATAGRAGRKADAYRIDLRADLADMTGGRAKGDLQAHYEHKQGGFSSLDEQIADTKETWGVKGDVELAERLGAGGSYAETRISGGKRDREAEGHVEIGLGGRWSITPGVRHNDRRDSLDEAKDQGSRTDAGARLAYKKDDDHSVYVFGQGTVDRSGGRRRNDRGGIGGETKLTEKTTLAAEASYGTSGIGGLAELGYKPTADDHYYIGYRLDPDRGGALGFPYDLDGDDLGAIVAGARHRYSERLSVFAEDSYDMFGRRRTLAQAYGVNYTPDARWTLGANVEAGEIEDDSRDSVTGVKNSDFDRTAIGASAGYKGEDGLTGRLKGEIRFEDSDDGTRDRTSYLAGATAGVNTSEDWRILANLDAVFSDATASTLDGDYLESSLGYAYRPVDNDRLNALFKYTFLYDFPGADQVTVNGTTLGPAQRSHILSADVTYDINPIISVGGKYGFRIGETKPRDGSGGWEEGSAHLGILRADLHVVKSWDVLLEGRLLWTPGADSTDLGALAAVYRHIGENFKVGVGYNFGEFSDDLRDLTFDDHGVFINAVGKF
jgi:hypothetical protein